MKQFHLTLAILTLFLTPARDGFAQSAGVLREVYDGIAGTTIPDLTSSPAFPSSPSSVEVLPTFEAPTDVADYYGQRLSAYLLPPTTGDYNFWVASDDNSILFLSTDTTPGNKTVIASVPGWTSSREWGKYSEQASMPVSLVGGRKYYIEALMKEGSGGDNLAVRWQLPDGTIEEPIPGSRLQVFGLTPPQITQQPANVTVTEGGVATFSVQIAWAYGAAYQWQRGAANIPGATGSAYTLAPALLSDNNAQFRCLVTNGQGSTNSAYAT
ncbi:MAG TPA: PA14 domain-containing protein, partial [Verrucomicrobiae bacterium]